MHCQKVPTDSFTILEPLNLQNDVPVQHKIRRSYDFKALKLWKGRSGKKHDTGWQPTPESAWFQHREGSITCLSNFIMSKRLVLIFQSKERSYTGWSGCRIHYPKLTLDVCPSIIQNTPLFSRWISTIPQVSSFINFGLDQIIGEFLVTFWLYTHKQHKLRFLLAIISKKLISKTLISNWPILTDKKV